MRNEFVGEYGSVGLDFNEVDGHGRDFGQNGPAQRVGKGEVGV